MGLLTRAFHTLRINVHFVTYRAALHLFTPIRCHVLDGSTCLLISVPRCERISPGDKVEQVYPRTGEHKKLFNRGSQRIMGQMCLFERLAELSSSRFNCQIWTPELQVKLLATKLDSLFDV